MKKIIALILAVMMLAISSSAFASYSDISKGAAYEEAVTRVTSLGIMDGTNGQFKPNNVVTRVQFAQIMVSASGMEDKASSLSGPTVYSDVAANGSYNGYINAAVQKGYISSMADGKFHPNDAINFAQICTALVKALGYTDQDVPGLWPKNYIEKAKFLHLTDGVSLSSSDKVPRWAMAVMIDNLLDTNVKKNNASEADKTFGSTVNLSRDSIYSVYSKPEIAHGFNPSTQKLGSIDFKGNPSIVRNTIDNSTTPATNNTGESINIYQIKENDVVYQVSDTQNKNRYILVVDNKVTGDITGISPDKYAPKSIQVDGKSYDLGKYFNTSKINSAAGSYNIGDSVILLLGYDGKVADLVDSADDDTSNYAFVLNYSSQKSSTADDYGTTTYWVKLMFTNGSTGTYKTTYDASVFKGKLVTFTKSNDQVVTMNLVAPSAQVDLAVQKSERQLGDSYATDGVKVLNFISNVAGQDCQVNMLSWNDLPYSTIPAGKIMYLNRAGQFNDINLIVVSDIYDQYYRPAYVERIQGVMVGKNTSYTYTLLIDGNEYKYTAPADSTQAAYAVGSIVRVSFSNNTVNFILDNVQADVTTSKIQAADAKRVRVNGTVYRFKDNVNIYYKDAVGNISIIGTKSIDTSKTYGSVAVYLDKPLSSNGKAVLIFISEL